ncbi:hypothetical protein AAU61_03105 [Desulfocarbo indianensis]|nr:hypothetical protein AAU61_03105 [Desulfocarbo indianensis]
MEVVYTYSHLGGEEILLVRYPEINREINAVISDIANPGRNKKSKEKTKKGKSLYSPREINALFRERFSALDWRELKDYYTVEIPDYPHVIPQAYKQCDFYKDPVLVEVQLGKYAFMFYDLAKFQYFYNQGKIRVGVEIVPCHFLQKQMSSGVSYGEQLIYDLERLSKNFPSVPVKIILIDMPLGSDDYEKAGREEVRKAYEETKRRLNRL